MTEGHRPAPADQRAPPTTSRPWTWMGDRPVRSARLARSAWRRSPRCWRALVGPVGAADDRPGAGGWPAGAALAVELDHDLGAQGGVLLLAAHPGGQLLVGAFPGREQAAVEGHKRRVQLGRGRG